MGFSFNCYSIHFRIRRICVNFTMLFKSFSKTLLQFWSQPKNKTGNILHFHQFCNPFPEFEKHRSKREKKNPKNLFSAFFIQILFCASLSFALVEVLPLYTGSVTTAAWKTIKIREWGMSSFCCQHRMSLPVWQLQMICTRKIPSPCREFVLQNLSCDHWDIMRVVIGSSSFSRGVLWKGMFNQLGAMLVVVLCLPQTGFPPQILLWACISPVMFGIVS